MITITIDSRRATPGEIAFATRAVRLLKHSPVSGVVVDVFELKPDHSPVYVVDRVDFVPPATRCQVCHRPLSSGSAYIVKAENGVESPCGPSCLTRIVPGYKNLVIPDFTKASRMLPSENGRQTEVRLRAPKKQQVDRIEEEYIRLRYEKLHGFHITDFDKLHAVYDRYLSSGVLEDEDRGFIQRMLERMPSSKMPGLSLENLQACYAYDHWLEAAIAALPDDKQEYLSKLQADLRRRLFLTPNQVEAANKWLSKIDGMPELDPAPFKWAADRATGVERTSIDV